MCHWSIVRIPGSINARAKISNSTFYSKEKNSRFAGIAGAVWLRTILNGESVMESFSLNCAKSFLGRNVNLHLKDGAVIVNVHLVRIKKSTIGKRMLVEYVPYGYHQTTQIPLRSIAWAELLNLSYFQTAG